MKKIIFFLVLFLSFVICPFFSASVFAQNKNSSEYYQEFLQNYRQYQSLVEPFNTVKSRHLAIQSVETQAAFLEASRGLILSEINAMTSYANFIKAQLAEATQILEYRDNFIYIKLDDEISFLNVSKTNAEKLSSLADSQTLMNDLSGHYLKIKKMGYQIKSIIETESARKIFSNLKVDRDKLGNYFNENKSEASQVLAAKEKYSSLNKEIDLGANFLSQADVLQKEYDQTNNLNASNPQEVSVEIREIINQILKSISTVVSGYKSIIFSLNQ